MLCGFHCSLALPRPGGIHQADVATRLQLDHVVFGLNHVFSLTEFRLRAFVRLGFSSLATFDRVDLGSGPLVIFTTRLFSDGLWKRQPIQFHIETQSLTCWRRTGRMYHRTVRVDLQATVKCRKFLHFQCCAVSIARWRPPQASGVHTRTNRAIFRSRSVRMIQSMTQALRAEMV